MPQHVFYRTLKVDGLSIFYRESGPKDGPVLLLLHGFESSSRMFVPLFSRLSDRYPQVAWFSMIDWVDCTTVMIGRPSPKTLPSFLNICVLYVCALSMCEPQRSA